MPDTEWRASHANPNANDRIAAQRELQNLEIAREQYGNTNPGFSKAENSFFKKLTGYLGLMGLAAVVFTLLNQPEQLTLPSSGADTEIAPLQLGAAITFVIGLWIFVCLSMINRGKGRFISKIMRRFAFSVVVAIIVAALVTLRISGNL